VVYMNLRILMRTTDPSLLRQYRWEWCVDQSVMYTRISTKKYLWQSYIKTNKTHYRVHWDYPPYCLSNSRYQNPINFIHRTFNNKPNHNIDSIVYDQNMSNLKHPMPRIKVLFIDAAWQCNHDLLIREIHN